MKRVFSLIVVCLAVAVAVFAQEKPQLAVVEFSTNLNNERVKAHAIAVRNLVESAITGTQKYIVITRDEIDKLLNEQKIAVSSISSNESRDKLKLKKISYIVTGSVNAMDNDYAIAINVLDVFSGEFPHSVKGIMGSSSRELFNGIDELITKLVAGMSTTGGRITQTDSGKIYKVGDFGPTGGYIFYDKGVFSNGWRYLEAAPFETEFTAQWGTYEKDVAGTNTGVGFGKRNTEIIVERLKSLGETGKAAQLCVNLNFDGYKDWFLPSRDELDLMYKNLKQKGLGRFGSRYYWSSSQDGKYTAWYQRFSDGAQYGTYGLKNDAIPVRAVRAF